MSNRGLIYGIVAYTIWGFFPLYWRALDSVSASEILVHRIIWSFVFLVSLLAIQKQWRWIKNIFANPKQLLPSTLAAFLLAGNWFIYIWGVNSGFVVETSLGYFINPLVNVLLGVIFLKERLRPGQWLSMIIAFCGVLYLTFGYGSFPWIAISLALSFGFYGLLKKKINFRSTNGLLVEMGILVLPALLFWLALNSRDSTVSFKSDFSIMLLLALGGVVTIVPLIFFSAAAQLIPLSMLGILQYIGPTLQFLIGVFIFDEPFSTARMIGFLFIWVALLVYGIEGYWQRRLKALSGNQPSSASIIK